MRFGWAKEYADGALGSGTAALFAPRTCGDGGCGILRLDAEELDALFAAARRRGSRWRCTPSATEPPRPCSTPRSARPPEPEVPADRVEHAQLVARRDLDRFARLGVTASIQPIHAAADRDLVEACWDGRQAGAYAWRRSAAGALLAAGSDAPVESVNPWLGVFAASIGASRRIAAATGARSRR